MTTPCRPVAADRDHECYDERYTTMANFIPRKDSLYDTWLANFTNFVTTTGPSLGLTPEQIAEMEAANLAWRATYDNNLSTHQTARMATQTKDMERQDSEFIARQLARIISANPDLNNTQREAAGLTLPEATAVSSSPELIDTIAAPLVVLDFSQRSKMIIHYGHNPMNERHNALPLGMKGCKIWYCLGGIPASDADWRFVVDHVRSPYIHNLTIETSTMVAYRVQYFDRKYRLSSFSIPQEAMVTK